MTRCFRRSRTLALAAALWPAQCLAAAAFAIGPCNESSPTELDYLVEHKAYAQGAIRVFSVDTYGEPVCCSAHLIVYIPAKDEIGAACFHISAEAGDGVSRRGFYKVGLDAARARYEPGEGLTLSVPVEHYDPERDRSAGDTVSFVINQARVTVEKK